MFRLNVLVKNWLCLLLICPCYFSVSAKVNQLDPTKPFSLANMPSNDKNSSANAFDKLVLQSIVERNNEKIAIISGQLLKIGDKVAEYKLITIKHNSVILQSIDKKLTLSLYSDIVTTSK